MGKVVVWVEDMLDPSGRVMVTGVVDGVVDVVTDFGYRKCPELPESNMAAGIGFGWVDAVCVEGED